MPPAVLEKRLVERINIPISPAFRARFLAVAGDNPTQFARRAVEKEVELKERRMGKTVETTAK